MKLKFTLQRSGKQSVDLIATIDASTTVGDLAAYLAMADPTRNAFDAGTLAGGGSHPGRGEVTLGLVAGRTLALDARATVGDSGLRSGTTVSLVRSGAAYRDPTVGSAAVLLVTSGPDAGREFPLNSGTNIVGRQRGCDVKLSDPLVSRQHTRINVTDVVEVVDLGSANGMLVGETVAARTVLAPGDTVRIGDTSFSVRITAAAPTIGVEATAVSFVRPPRLDPVYPGQEFVAPQPPERPHAQRFPMVALVAPILMGGILYAVTRSATSLVFVALSPLMMIGNAVETRLANRSAYKRALKLFRADLADLVEDLKTATNTEVTARKREHPSTSDCVDAIRRQTPLLWTRRPGERGFTELRLGLGTQPSRNTVKLPEASRAPRVLFKELVDAVAPFATVDPVPVLARPGEHGGLGIAGARNVMLGVARATVAQVVSLHSPAEVVVCAVASTQTARDWNWLKWLPHTTSVHSPIPVGHLACTVPTASTLVSEIEALIDVRAESDDAQLPSVVLLVENDAPVEHSRLVELAEHGWKQGVFVVWLATAVSQLPAACRTFAELDQQTSVGAAGYVHSAELVQPLAAETLSPDEALEIARRLSPMVDIGARIDDASDLPRAVSLLTLVGPDLAGDPDAVIEQWTQNRSIITGPYAPPTPPKHAGTLRAVIGQSAGEPLALDLRTDGPHALVGGTTGSGKSELLQAWILAMAAAHSPQRLTFLLVDYKGGSAFRDCVALPHTVGLVTDLSPHLVRRALTSLSAELKFREELLAKHSAKDLVTLEKQGHVDAPPSLVLVVDEFAALVQEVPEFVDGVVNVAQRGRSLGLHLILATQRPQGVIKDNLRANTNLRLALRMADEGDSSDVLGSPQAAFFDPAIPGRAVSKTGPGRLVPFQTGYAGGWTTQDAPPPEILVAQLEFGSTLAWEAPDNGDVVTDDLGPTDIRRLVSTIGTASEQAGIQKPRKPWLPELKAVYDLADQTEVPSRRSDTELVFGIRDDPDNQAQPTVAFYPDREGNLAVYGTGGSGKSTLLRTLAIAAGFTVRGGPCHVYGIDFGARGLSMLEELPHVGSIISGSDHERITRLLGWLRGLIDERALRYSKVNAGTITDYRRIANAPNEARILLLVDGIAAFRQAYEAIDRIRWFDMLTSIATEGRPVGLHVILSSETRGGMPTALAAAVQSRLVLRLASEDDYGYLGIPVDVLNTQSPPGRAVVADSETQVAVLGGTSDVVAQSIAVRGFGESMRKAGVQPCAPIESLPERVLARDLPFVVGGRPVIGLSSTTLGPLTFEPRGSFIVAGPPGSGRTTALQRMLNVLVEWDKTIRLYYIGSPRSALVDYVPWQRRVLDPTEAVSAAPQLAELVRSSSMSSPIAIVIESAGDYVTGPADFPLMDLVKACLASDAFLIVEGESSAISGQSGFLGAAKGGRTGLVLAPDQADGTTLFRTNFPRMNRAAFPSGRGVYVALGKTEVVQVAIPTMG